MEDDTTEFLNIAGEWMDLVFRTNVIPRGLSTDTIEHFEISTPTSFQRASLDKLIRFAGVRKFTDGCRDQIEDIIKLELYHILRTAIQLKKRRILHHEDIVNALHVMNIKVPMHLDM